MAIRWLDPDADGVDVEGGPDDNTDALNAFLTAAAAEGKTAGLPDEGRIRCNYQVNGRGSIFAPNGGTTGTAQGTTYTVIPPRRVTDGALTNTSTTLTSTQAQFSSADIGARVVARRTTWPFETFVPDGTKIASVSGSTATMTNAATASVSGVQVVIYRTGTRGCEIFTDYYATDDPKVLDSTNSLKYHTAPYDAAIGNRKTLTFRNLNDWTIEGLTLTGPNVRAAYITVVELQAGLQVDNCDRFAVRNCVMRQPHGDGVRLGDVGGYNTDGTFTNVTVTNVGRQMFTPAAIIGLLVTQTVLDTGPRTCIDLERFGGAPMDNITFRECTARGWRLNFISATGSHIVNLNIEDFTLDGGPIDVHFPPKGADVIRGPLTFDGLVSNSLSKSSQEMFTFDNCHDITIRNCVGAVQASREQAAVVLSANVGAYCVDGSNSFPGAIQTVRVSSGVNLGNCVDTPAPVSVRPVVTGPIQAGATSVSGTSVEADGTVIAVFVNSAAAGSATVTSGAWTATVAALTAGQVVTAKATAPGESQSTSSDPVTVVAPPPPAVSDIPVVTGPLYAGAVTVFGTSTESNGSVITVLVNGVSAGTATVTSGQWSKAVTALTEGQVVTAKAQTGGETQSAASSPVTVLAAVRRPNPIRRTRMSGRFFIPR